MKVKVKDLRPNPFRDLPHYAIDLKRVEILKNSIDSTGFWDNLLARKNKDGDIEIAYGHHRLVALKEALGGNHEVDIPVRPLADEDMLKIMANENETMFEHDPRVVIETVKQTKDFLEKSPDVVKKLLKDGKNPGRGGFSPGGETKEEIGTRIICRFLGGNWNEHKVSTALQALKSADPEVIEKAPSLKHVEYISRIPDKEVQKKVLKKVRAGKLVNARTGEKRPLTVDETQREVFKAKVKSEKAEKRGQTIDISEVIDSIYDHINIASVLLSEKIMENWNHVSDKQKKSLLLILGNFMKKISQLYKKEKKAVQLIEGD